MKQKLRKGQEKKLNQALLQRHAASAQRIGNPVISLHAGMVGNALIRLAERYGSTAEAFVLTQALDAYEAEINRLSKELADYQAKDANNL